MRLRSVRLFQFRNVPDAIVDCDHGRVFFEGPNGQGKTNFLESIAFLQSLRSFRISDRSALIGHQLPSASIQAVWEHEQQGRSEVSIILEKRSRRVAVDGEPVKRLSSYIGQFPSVMMASQDIQLIRGGPGERRRFLDMVFAGIDPGYLAIFQRFQKTLLERNQLLKQGRSDAELNAFDKVWIPASWELTQYRGKGIGGLDEVVRSMYLKLADGAEQPALKYAPNLQAESLEAWSEVVLQSRERDRALRSTQKGPHRDDFKIFLDGHLASAHASEGQQRGLVLALRFGELSWVREQTGRLPILLADDILTELDAQRRARFWRLTEDWAGLQILATGTHFPESEAENNWKRYQVKKGDYIQI